MASCDVIILKNPKQMEIYEHKHLTKICLNEFDIFPLSYKYVTSVSTLVLFKNPS